jgi:Zn-finger nucleic acid-binding protein
VDCANGHPSLRERRIGDVRVHECATCGGTWYDRDELRLLKDRESGGVYRWLDVELWKDRSAFKRKSGSRVRCPQDRTPLVTVKYGDSAVAVDVCDKCHGVWLARNEFDAILEHLRRRVDTATADEYVRDLRDELREVLSGPEGPLSELADVAKVASLLQLRFTIEHPALLEALQRLPKV